MAVAVASAGLAWLSRTPWRGLRRFGAGELKTSLLLMMMMMMINDDDAALRGSGAFHSVLKIRCVTNYAPQGGCCFPRPWIFSLSWSSSSNSSVSSPLRRGRLIRMRRFLQLCFLLQSREVARWPQSPADEQASGPAPAATSSSLCATTKRLCQVRMCRRRLCCRRGRRVQGFLHPFHARARSARGVPPAALIVHATARGALLRG